MVMQVEDVSSGHQNRSKMKIRLLDILVTSFSLSCSCFEDIYVHVKVLFVCTQERGI